MGTNPKEKTKKILKKSKILFMKNGEGFFVFVD